MIRAPGGRGGGLERVMCSVDSVLATVSQIRRVPRPGGRYVFTEHVAAPEGSWLQAAQWATDPLQRCLAGGCRPTREPRRGRAAPAGMLATCSAGGPRCSAIFEGFLGGRRRWVGGRSIRRGLTRPPTGATHPRPTSQAQQCDEIACPA
ncbi:unnamed protein product [Prorocentrum cordatum]|uniref:Uncharacterized protein n=1 Tax=Prorocentrum cordatum TaxID=2364126 RepID=A0ABN9PNC4_9DINO|nr:unnamed protein product [Polarella glacialis]